MTGVSVFDKRWTTGLKEQDRRNLEILLGSNNLVLDKLIEICYNMIKGSEMDASDYDNPNWALKQADKVGYRRAIKQIIMLCSGNKADKA
jgi:hypothetical protein